MRRVKYLPFLFLTLFLFHCLRPCNCPDNDSEDGLAVLFATYLLNPPTFNGRCVSSSKSYCLEFSKIQYEGTIAVFCKNMGGIFEIDQSCVQTNKVGQCSFESQSTKSIQIKFYYATVSQNWNYSTAKTNCESSGGVFL
ncbi:hypothetical protein LEP1GSC151_1176 [Leptospira interrogans serovar Grippotyphosa str. LT2186]|uniref:Uncharacterized protein n=1 Tax=Leptospira interrogans serovar Grippotyphosa str. LT2186 TaxID=1001599 RepID=M3HAR9_LEPIR|nr:hypothetical protein [Leptospira interrogans]EKR45088.1 hypothetical protein LEP1GSC097_3385 [Leptospira interrogans serovar Grippotyphosa str. UI 08368]EMG09795.1 hypothetical protein LEP1GSC151_1176 [Leptospira interrogans serovar Grippotyphosa str. LT2186]EMN86180.1 hypothetical protein LEP1GSC107_2991 [Leptospira interrogans serovar Grippotyphosa str. UI 12769]